MRIGRAVVVCLAVVLMVALMGVARVRILRSAQTELVDEINRQMAVFEAASIAAVSPEQIIQENANMRKALNADKLSLAALGTAGALAAAAVAAMACAAIAWISGSAKAVACMGLWVWLVNGAAVGAIAHYGTTSAFGLVPFPGYLPRTPSGGFAAFLVIGLASAFFWQSFLPALAAGYLGLKGRAWWLAVQEVTQTFESEPAMAAPISTSSRACRCGAVNVLDRASCYACGVSFGESDE